MNIASIRDSDEEFHLLETTGRTQTATMTLKPGAATSGELEIHPHSDQVVLVLEGALIAETEDERCPLAPDQSIIIPAGVKHRFVNEGQDTAFAFTVYGPPAYETGDPH